MTSESNSIFSESIETKTTDDFEITQNKVADLEEVFQHEDIIEVVSNQNQQILEKLKKANLPDLTKLSPAEMEKALQTFKADMEGLDHDEIENTVRMLRNNTLSDLKKQTFTHAVKHEDEVCRKSPLKDYHLVREFINLFLAKEKFINDEIRNKGDKIAELHQHLNSLIKLSNFCNKDKLPDEAIELIEDLHNKEIILPFAGEDQSNKITIQFSKTKDFNKEDFLKNFEKDAFRSSVFTYMDQTKLGIQQWFTALQDDITNQMACLEIVKASLKTGDPIRTINQNIGSQR